MAADDEINAQMTMDVDSVVAGASEAADAVEESAGRMEEGFGGVGEALESIQGSIKNAFEILGITAAYEAIEKVADALGEITEKGEHLEQTARLYQTTTDSLQGLYHAAITAGIGTETMDRGLRILEARMQAAREGSVAMQDKLDAVGITMANLRDPAFQSAEAMYAIAQSGATTGEMMSVLGPRAILVAESFENLKNGQEAANAAAVANGALTEEQIALLAEYHKRISAIGEAWSNFKMLLVSELVPGIEEVMNSFSLMFGGMVTGQAIIDEIKNVIWVLSETMMVLSFSVKQCVNAFMLLQDVVGDVAKQVVAVMTGDFVGAAEVMGGTVDRVANYATGMVTDFNNLKSSIEDTNAAFEGFGKDWGDDQTDWEGKKKEKEKPPPIEIPPPKVTGEDPILKMIGIQMEEAKKGSQERIDLAEQYATRSAQVYEGDVDKAIDSYKKNLDAVKEFNAEKLKSAEDSAKKVDDLEQKSFDEALKLLNQAHSAKHLDDATYLADEEAIIKAKLAANEDYYDQLDKLDAGNTDKLRKNLADREKMEEASAKANYDVQAKAAQETEKAWESAMKPIEASFSSAIQSMVQGTATFQQAFKKMLDEIVINLFKNAMDTMVHNWVTGEQQKTNATIIGDKLRTQSADAAATQTAVASSTGAKTEIQNSGLAAMAGAYKAMVGVPYIGPILAVAAMAAAEAAVLGLIGKIASAEGGMVVDKDQMAMVHEDEMILPSHISQGINERILGNEPLGGSGSGTGSGGDHYHITAHDASSFEKYVTSYAGRTAIAKAAKMASSRGNRNIRSYGR